MSDASRSGEYEAPHQKDESKKSFVAHSYQAEWHDTIEAVCNELLPEYGLQPWYAEYNYDPTTTLRDKIVSMIDNAPYGIYDLSYWRANEGSPWVMPCNVLIELGIAIALNRPTILLRHVGNRMAEISLPKSIQSVAQKICEFTGDYSLEVVLRKYLSDPAHLSTDYDWHHHRCRFGEIDCSHLQVYPHTAMIGRDNLHCHIADGSDADQLDFRHIVETVLGRFNNISYSYLDKGSVPNGYTFLLCAYCQLIRSTPFAIYRITPDTSPDTYIAIGISIGLEYRFKYKIPRFMITKDMQYVPSLLHGYQCVVVKNLHALKTCLPQFVQHVMTKIDEPAYWRPQELPFETRVPYSFPVHEEGEVVEEERIAVNVQPVIFSIQLRYERSSRAWTLEQLAAELGVSEQTVFRWESGVVQPARRYREKLCEIFDKSPEELGFIDQQRSEKTKKETNSTIIDTRRGNVLAGSYSGLQLDRVHRQVRIDGILLPRPLPAKQLKLLEFLATRAGRVCLREEVSQAVYHESYVRYRDDRRLDALIERTRQCIGDDQRNPRFIETVRGIGYRLNNYNEEYPEILA